MRLLLPLFVLISLGFAPAVTFPAEAKHLPMTVTQTAKGYTFTLRVTNLSAQPIKVQPSSCESMAIERVSDGAQIWHGLETCTAATARPLTLKPGQSVTSGFSWDTAGQQATPGKYRALLSFDVGKLVGETTFMVKK